MPVSQILRRGKGTMEADESTMRLVSNFFLVGVHALSFFQCSDTVGWATGSLQKLQPLISKHSLPGYVEKKSKGNWLPKLTPKIIIKTEAALVFLFLLFHPTFSKAAILLPHIPDLHFSSHKLVHHLLFLHFRGVTNYPSTTIGLSVNINN